MSEDKLKRKLLEDVVIVDVGDVQRTGAQRLAPDHSPRRLHKEAPPPARGRAVAGGVPSNDVALLAQVQEFLYYQSELLDGKRWRDYTELFDTDGVYWMPVTADQQEWLDSPSIFAEDRGIMEIRAGRLTHPNAWSQAPDWGTNHVIGNVVIESADEREVVVRSRFHMMELRRDSTRHFAGRYLHRLRRHGDAFRIVLQRVDLMNGQAPYDYVLQAWV